MQRTIVVTGSASGIGRATAELLWARGHRVIGVDLKDADILADLATVDGRAGMQKAVAAQAPDGIDSVVAAAGVAVVPDPRTIIAVNYFGAVATLEGLRPLMANSSRPCAVAVLSSAALLEFDEELAQACLDGNEAAALAAVDAEMEAAYATSKYALSRWLRREAVKPEWAGAGVLLNGVAPGTVLTPMTLPILATEEGRELIRKSTPIAVDDYAQPEALAEVIAFLADMQGRYMVGQAIFVDGGTDAIFRPKNL